MKKLILLSLFTAMCQLVRADAPPIGAPTISSFAPEAGPVGTLVTITGTSLDGLTSFTIGGVEAITVSTNGTTLVGMVMPNAVTGPVAVTDAFGTATSISNFTVTPTPHPGLQQGVKLVGTGATGAAHQGVSVAVSADGNTAIVGAYGDATNKGAAWIYIRSGGTWSQQGSKLVGTGASGNAWQGYCVALSADGNTALLGGYKDDSERGATWVFTRTGTTWSQQGSKLVNTAGATATARQGFAVSLSADGNTAIVGAPGDNSYEGSVRIYVRTGTTWAQQGNKLVGTDASATGEQGTSVALSADGTTAMVGGSKNNANIGAAWVFTRSGATWTQQGVKLVGTGATFGAQQGISVSLSADGNTALVGGYKDDIDNGAAWVYTRSGSTWSQQGSKLVGVEGTSGASQGFSTALSADGNVALVGGFRDNSGVGATWVYTRSGITWTQQNGKLVGTGAIGPDGFQARSISLSADGTTAMVAGGGDNSGVGAAWPFTPRTEWTGATDTDWNVSSNWNMNTVPTASEDIVIPSVPSNQPHVTSAPGTPALCADLTIHSGAALTVNAGKALTVSGDTDNKGTILVKADATGIGSFIDNGTVTGNGVFQMEQYLTGAGGATPNGMFYYVSSPVVGADASTYGIPAANKLWSADETTQSYPQISNGATALNPMQGYVARMGADGAVTFSGSSFNTGNQSAAGLTRTGTTALNRGYNLIGNPYPSSVNWSDVDTTNLFGTIWYRTHTGGEVAIMTYDTYNAVSAVGTSNNYHGTPATGIIPPTQAVWVRVKADNSSASVNFTNAMRSHGTLSGIYKQAAEEGTIRMTLSDGTTSDEAILLFDENASDDFDAYDSHKFWASNIPQLYMNEAADTVVINGLYSTATNPVVDLGVKLRSSGEYSLNANSITLTGESVHLEDRLLNVFQDLNAEPNYSFASTAGNIGNRFALHFGMTAVGIADAINRVSTRVYTSNGNQLNIILSDKIERGQVDVLDMTGRVVYTSNLNASRSTFNLNASTGVYLVRVETANGIDTHCIILN